MCRLVGRHVRPQEVFQPPPPVYVPLKSLAYSVRVIDFVAEVSIKQKFVNEEKEPIEAVYEFNMEPNASVCAFYAEIDGKRIKGRCQEKEAAKDHYDDAIASGHGAYLLEQSKDRPDVFTASVGNLEAGKEAIIEVVYVKELEFNEEGELRFFMPASRPAPGTNIPSPTLEISLAMTSNIKKLSSPTHPIAFEFGDEMNQATVKLAEEGSKNIKDFELLVKLFKPHEPCVRVQVDEEGRTAAMVAIYPDLKLGEDQDMYTEIIFLVDQSGSMSGSRMNQVKSCLQLMLQSLPEGTLFNIVGFGTSFKKLFTSGSVEYDEKNLKVANEHLSKMSANMGGTNILTPLLEIFKEKPKEGIPRQLFILTDGEVSNTAQCIDAVRKHANTTRVFTFGIGRDASEALVKGMAKAGEGSHEIIAEVSGIEEKVMRQLKRAMKPALVDLKVNWGDFKVESQAPFRLPPLFAGNRLVVYGFLPKDATSGAITVTAASAVKPYSATLQVDCTKAEKGSTIHRLASKVLIKDIEENRSCFHNDQGVLNPNTSTAQLKSETIRVSTSYGILCKLTAFVAIEERDTATEGQMNLRKVSTVQESFQSYPPPPQLSPIAPPSRLMVGMGAPPMGAKRPLPPPMAVMAPCVPMPMPPMALPSRSMAAPIAMESMSMAAMAMESMNLAAPMAMESMSLAAPSREKAMAAPMAMAKRKVSSHAEKKKESEDWNRSSDADNFAFASSRKPTQSNFAPAASMMMEDVQEKEEETQAAPAPETVRSLIMQQQFAGSWTLQSLQSVMKQLPLALLQKSKPSTLAADAEGDSIWATVLVIATFSLLFGAHKTFWEMVVTKAKKWLSKTQKKLNLDGDALQEAANKVIQENAKVSS